MNGELQQDPNQFRENTTQAGFQIRVRQHMPVFSHVKIIVVIRKSKLYNIDYCTVSSLSRFIKRFIAVEPYSTSV